MRKARIDENEIVVEVYDSGDNEFPKFHSSLTWHECSSDVTQGWRWLGDHFAPPLPTPAPSKEDLLAYLANKRFTVETGGKAIAGIKVATDRDSQSLITSAYLRLQRGDATIINWKKPDGIFVQLGLPQMTMISKTVGDHVQACFDKEASLAGEIDSGTITTYQQIEDAEWPSNGV